MSGLESHQILLIVLLMILPILPNLWSIWHIFHRNFKTPQEKMAWIGITVFIPALGGIIYILCGRKRSIINN